jgi:hypothetical protein
VGDLINQDTEISAEFTLLGQGGSKVIQGSMLVLPIEQSIMYVQPIYIQASSGSSAPVTVPAFGGQAAQEVPTGIPEFKRVVVSFGGDIEMRDTLDEALDAVFGEGTAPDVEPPSPGEDGVVVPEEVAALVDAAEQALADADAALRTGDLGTYSEKVAEAQGFIERAAAIIAAETAG